MDDGSALIEPLTRLNYKRAPAVERQIADGLNVEPEVLIERVRARNSSGQSCVSAEALVYFIRRAVLNNETTIRDALFRELFERCVSYFRGQFRGFAHEVREDMQGEVMLKITEDIFAQDDRGDYMQVRFWKYLQRRCIDACRAQTRYLEKNVSLESGQLRGEGNAGLRRLEKKFDSQLSPEEFVMISEALEQLPSRLRRVFLLRHYVGLKIGSDRLRGAKGQELSIAAHFGRSGRTIRNWLREANRLLAMFQEMHDGE